MHLLIVNYIRESNSYSTGQSLIGFLRIFLTNMGALCISARKEKGPEQSETHDVAGDARLALLMRYKWKAEIEQAVDKEKNYKKRSAPGKWFRKEWFQISPARSRNGYARGLVE